MPGILLLGCFLLYVAAYNVYRLARGTPSPAMDDRHAARIPRWKTVTFVGLPMGLVGGLLGIGGGALAVPLQQLLLRVPLKRAIACSATTIIFVAAFGACYKNATLGRHVSSVTGQPFGLWDSATLAGLLIPTAIVGGYLGGWLTHGLPLRAVRAGFVGLMIYAGLRLLAHG